MEKGKRRKRGKKAGGLGMGILLLSICVLGGLLLKRFLPPASKGQPEGTVSPIPTQSVPMPTTLPDSTGKPTEELPEVVPTSQPEAPGQQDNELWQRAEQLLSEMTIEEKIGQMFLVRCPEEQAAQLVEKYHLGGYILFGRDFKGKSRQEVISAIESYQERAELPLFIAVDEEGGTVNRVSTNSQLRKSPFLSPRELYSRGGWELIESDTKEKCELLQDLGINLNLAPVCDISQDPKDFIYERSFGKDASLTAAYVTLVVRTMREQGMGSALKHFPGYGNNLDTHTGVAYDERSYREFEESDLLPFSAGIGEGADLVLVSHNIVACMDAERPASLSPKVHELLREKLGFSGLIITDDLAMQGIRKYTGDSEAAVMAVQAGNDLLCCTDFEVQIPAVYQAVEQGILSEEQIQDSARRILMKKIELGLIR